MVKMTEAEAAAFLQVTPRTLRNYRQSGELPYREVPGKTRPIIDYQQGDIERLKAKLEKRRQRSKKPVAVKPGLPRVTFSLPPPEHEELSAEAKKYEQSPGEYARRLVREGLESRALAETAELRAEVDSLNAEIRKMKKEFLLAFEVVLEFSGVSKQDAKTWVDNNLR